MVVAAQNKALEGTHRMMDQNASAREARDLQPQSINWNDGVLKRHPCQGH